MVTLWGTQILAAVQGLCLHNLVTFPLRDCHSNTEGLSCLGVYCKNVTSLNFFPAPVNRLSGATAQMAQVVRLFLARMKGWLSQLQETRALLEYF